MVLSIAKYWESNTPPPALNEAIGKYQIKSQLHEPTNYSCIYLCSNLENDEKKVLKFVKCKRNEINNIQNEINTLSFAKHPNIIEMDEYFIYNEYVCIVTSFAPLKCLRSFISENYNQGIPEDMASKIMYQLLDATNYLHKNNIWHRDIKTENILVIDSDPKNPKVKLTDFGSSGHFEKGEKSDEFIGTPNYTAPEIFLHNNYNEKVDIWSLGITLFVMLTGMLPVPSFSKNPRACRSMIINGLLNFEFLEGNKISNDAIDLVMKMCTVDPESRITCEDALNHPWIVSQRSKNFADTNFSEKQAIGYYICK